MSDFESHAFDIVAAQSEMDEFRVLLDGSEELKERKQVLKSFDGWKNLCALFGMFHGKIRTADRIRREFTVDKFRADLVVGASEGNSFCFVEFEGAKRKCIFKKESRWLPVWSQDFEKGFSQIVDWAWALDIGKSTPIYPTVFGSSRPDCIGVLVIGRDGELRDPVARDRWEFRSRKVSVDGWSVILLTYDELFIQFDTEIKSRCEYARQIAKTI